MDFIRYLVFCFLAIACISEKGIDTTYPPYLVKNTLMGDFKTIKIPEYPDAFNGSIFAVNNKKYMLYRFDDATGSNMGLSELSDDFVPKNARKIGCNYQNASKKESYCQDPRVIMFNGELNIVFNDIREEFSLTRKMYIAILRDVDKSSSLEDIHPLKFSLNKAEEDRIEKNWSPFVFEGSLYFIYSGSPHTILKMEKDKTLHLVEKNEFIRNPWSDFSTKRNLYWKIMGDVLDIRGGTPAVQDPFFHQLYLTFFHVGLIEDFYGKNKFLYVMGAYYFNPENFFEIEIVSGAPIIVPGLYSKKITTEKVVAFPTGVLVQEKSIIVSIGHMDNQMGIVSIDRDNLLSSFVAAEHKGM